MDNFDSADGEPGGLEPPGGYAPPVPDELDLVLETGSLLSMAAAQRFERVAAFWRNALRDEVPFRGGTRDIAERSVRLELAAAMRITEYAVERLVMMATALTTEFRDLLDALHGGRVTVRHADVFVDLVTALEPHLRGQVIARGVQLAEALPVGAFRRELRKLVDVARAPSAQERHIAALADRRVVVEPAEDGMAWLATLMPEVEARAIFERATRIAKAIVDHPDETRTLHQARADVIGDLLTDGDVATHPDAARGIRAEVIVTVPALSLLDDAEAAKHPAMVEGVGPIPISRARELCGGQKEWMRVLTHPETGIVLSVGRTTYTPPKPLRRLVSWRAGRCLAPGCGMPAHRCQIDHQLAWADGGETALWNNAPLCQGHHTVKHHGGWRVRQLDAGVVEWTSPTGRVYPVEPEHVTPAFRPHPHPHPPHADVH